MHSSFRAKWQHEVEEKNRAALHKLKIHRKYGRHFVDNPIAVRPIFGKRINLPIYILPTLEFPRARIRNTYNTSNKSRPTDFIHQSVHSLLERKEILNVGLCVCA